MRGPFRRPLTADEVAALSNAADREELVRLALELTASGASQNAIATAAGVSRSGLFVSLRQAGSRAT